MREWQKFVLIVAVFLAAYLVPFNSPKVAGAILESLHMLQEYAREHVLFCLVPAFFIAGAISNFISQGAVMRYLGAGANRVVAYAVASVSGSVLAVCSCTVLPLFAGIYRRGAGLGPAAAFLYSGPAINVLAIILTARVLGWKLGLARAVGAVLFSILVGLAMALLFRREESVRAAGDFGPVAEERRSPLQTLVFFVTLILILVFAAWGRPAQPVGFFSAVYAIKWYLVAGLLVVLGYTLVRWFDAGERQLWVHGTWSFAKQILPLLFGGVLVAGLLMGRPGTDAGLIPADWIARLVGGNSLRANLVASVAGALMYFATLTEVPILQGLLGAGMGQGPALALLLAGPALSLPSMLVIHSILGTKKTAAFIGLVVVMATVSGLLFGWIVG
ncbi:MAG: permease [Firmicutes bacterium]|nr:permease [Bacillota bacterium]